MMKPPYRLILIFAGFGLVCPLAHGQSAILDKTTLGQSQNDARELQNSLIVPKRVNIKGEKTEQVDPQKLSSRSTKDAKFQGSLLEMGLGSTGDPDTHQEKLRSATDQDSKAPNKTDGGAGKNSKTSKPTQAADGQNKDEKAKSVPSDERASEKEKASASKPDGNR